jgi:hypothetical protein
VERVVSTIITRGEDDRKYSSLQVLRRYSLVLLVNAAREEEYEVWLDSSRNGLGRKLKAECTN